MNIEILLIVSAGFLVLENHPALILLLIDINIQENG